MIFRFINRTPVELAQFEITPARDAHNKKVHDLFRSLSSFYVNPIERLTGKKPFFMWWDVMIRSDSIRFFVTVPSEYKKEVCILLGNTWESSSIEECVIHTDIPISSDVCEMKYRRSNLFSLQTDRRIELEPLNSIFSITEEMKPEDIARYSICTVPVSRLDWQDWSERNYDEFKKGKTPRRAKWSTKDIGLGIGELITGLLQSVADVVYSAMGGSETKADTTDIEKRLILIDGKLAPGTLNKLKAPTFNSYIRIASYSPDHQRQRIILRSISNSFNDLTADNELERHDYHSKLKPTIIRELNTFRISWASQFDKNKMSHEELGRMAEIPTAALQDRYEHINSLDTRQIDVPTILRGKGLHLGNVEYKKQSIPVSYPTTNDDQTCLPTCVIGGMGSGKTKGFACNRAVEFVKQGYSAVIFDPAKSEVWDVVSKALPNNSRRILLGQTPIALDFPEVKYSPEAKGRLAEILLTLFEDQTDSAGAQTQRYMRAAVLGMQAGKLSEIVKIFRDKEYREKAILTLPEESLARESLQEFHGHSPERQRQILAPILNRLDVIFGSPYLTECMRSNNSIDLVEVLSKEGMCTVFDIPDRLNSRAAKDILINLISLKIDIAMPFRKEFPLAVIYDEPHQYLRSAKLWEFVAVESRKYRLAYTWLFHSWEQIPSKLTQIIKDANPHFIVYSSSEETYRGLSKIISPYTVEDGLNLKQHHAICSLRAGTKRITPLIVRMAPPPTT